MSERERAFLFSTPGNKAPSTSRKVHIRRLYDVLQICIHRNDLQRAKQAWSILVRCKEVNWKAMWQTGVLLAGGPSTQGDKQSEDGLEYLSTMMLQHPEAREAILKEFILLLITSGQERRALDELELYLPSPPYQDNPALHVYAGFLCLYLSQPSILHRTVQDAERHFQRAKQLEPDNLVATAWLEKIPTITFTSQGSRTPMLNSDDEDMPDYSTAQHHKRART